jgi:transposase
LDTKDKIITGLIQKNDLLIKHVDKLENDLAYYKQRLARYENPKNSSNSSIPPSKDENRPAKNQSLREKSGKKPGGQLGHKGATLEMTATPDHIISHRPDYCQSCGRSLSEHQHQLESIRQVVDLPDIKAICTEHQQYSRQCTCGHKTVSAFPTEVRSPVHYGPGIEALISYLYGRQYIPYARMQEMFRDSYGVKISQGSIDNIIKRFAKKGEKFYERIKQEIVFSKVVGSDETGLRINGEKHWAWTWQDTKNTLIAISKSRGIQAISDHLGDILPNAILCHDAWRAQFSLDCKTHQLCCAHMLRELNYLTELHNQPWSIQFKQLLLEAINLKKKLTERDYHNKHPDIEVVEKKFSKLLDRPPDKKYTELYSFYKRINKYKDYIFPFLYYQHVPPDNNASERAIRNIKVKQKISGQFKSQQGARDFAIIRSIIDTLVKRSENVFQNLQIIANFST